MGVTKQVNHRLLVFLIFLALALQQHFLGSEQIGRDDLFWNLYPFAVHIERGTSHCRDALNLVVFEVLQMEGGAHGAVCTYGSQSHMEAHFPFSCSLVGNTQNAVVIVEVQICIVRHLLFIAVDECLRLGDV